MKLHTLFLLFILVISAQAGAFPCLHDRNKKGSAQKTTAADSGEDNYDMKYLRFDIHVSDTSVYVSGNVTTRAVVTAASMSSYIFELDTTLTIDSAFINGTMLPSVTIGSGFIRSISLPVALTAGNTFTAQVFYHGLPPGGGGGFFNGITHAVSPGGTHMVYTISDPYVAKNWWPCKQSIQDKIDSVDMLVTVPAHVVDGSNGVLLSVDTSTTPGYWQYHWHTNYMIDYYLISIAVARYSEYRSYMHFTASTDSMLIQNFFVDTATFNPAYKSNFDSIGQFINYFSSLYGRYPFWHEKYGVCYTTLPGGMEHQTMTTIGVPNTYIIAHELCHQWFGDNVTYQDWRDVWLSEGFATFSEQLFLDHFWSASAANAHRQSLLSSVLSSPCGRVTVTDTTNSGTLFDQPTVYNKGQAVVRMLQYIAPSDSVFFSVLRTYQQTYTQGHASTAQFKAIAEAAYGRPLDTFFNQWIYGSGYPSFRMYWNQAGSTVFVKLIQTRSCASSFPDHFYTPLEIQLHSATADTIIKVDNTSDTQVYVFNWSGTASNVYLNPDTWTILRLLSNTHDLHLGVGVIEGKEIKVFPNPAGDYWTVNNVESGIAMTLIDVYGKILWQGTSGQGTNYVPAAKLSPGNYVLRFASDAMEENIKISKQ